LLKLQVNLKTRQMACKFVANGVIMKSKKKPLAPENIPYEDLDMPSQLVQEDVIFAYKKSTSGQGYVRTAVSVWPTELAYSKFKHILNAHDLTLAEWASLLQISERTLNRYAKEDLSFNSILHERIQLLHTALLEVKALFGATSKAWLFGTPPAFGGKSPFDLLFTQAGITRVRQVLHSVQHGIVA
jgi:uncharacterized protein (DUF2384 family)